MEWTSEQDDYIRQCIAQIASQMQRSHTGVVQRIATLYALPREGGGKWTKEEEDLARAYFVQAENGGDMNAYWETHFKGKRSASAMKTYIETYIAPLRGQKTDVPSAVRLLKAKLRGMAKDETEKSNVEAYCMQIADFLISEDEVAPRKRQRKGDASAPENECEKMDVEKDESVFSI